MSNIHEMIRILAANETDRFVELLSHTESIKQTQSALLNSFIMPPPQCSKSMRESHEMAVDLAKKQSTMSTNQQDMIEMQGAAIKVFSSLRSRSILCISIIADSQSNEIKSIDNLLGNQSREVQRAL